jgi:hypothetical protein
MARVTLIFAFLLMVLGEVSYVGTGSLHKTALIPVWFGLALGLFGFLALRAKSEKGRMTLMHINVTIGLLGFLGGVGAAIQGYVSAHSHGHSPDMIALASKLTMAALTGIYVAMCVRSFIAVRRARQA